MAAMVLASASEAPEPSVQTDGDEEFMDAESADEAHSTWLHDELAKLADESDAIAAELSLPGSSDSHSALAARQAVHCRVLYIR